MGGGLLRDCTISLLLSKRPKPAKKRGEGLTKRLIRIFQQVFRTVENIRICLHFMNVQVIEGKRYFGISPLMNMTDSQTPLTMEWFSSLLRRLQ